MYAGHYAVYCCASQVLSVVASQVKCIQDAVTRFSNPDLREPQYQHLPAGIPNVKVYGFNKMLTRVLVGGAPNFARALYVTRETYSTQWYATRIT